MKILQFWTCLGSAQGRSISEPSITSGTVAQIWKSNFSSLHLFPLNTFYLSHILPGLKKNTWYPYLVPHSHGLPQHNPQTEKQALNIPAVLLQRPGNPSRSTRYHRYTCTSSSAHLAFPAWKGVFCNLVFPGTIEVTSKVQNCS